MILKNELHSINNIHCLSFGLNGLQLFVTYSYYGWQTILDSAFLNFYNEIRSLTDGYTE